jgi:hypothetical protein
MLATATKAAKQKTAIRIMSQPKVMAATIGDNEQGQDLPSFIKIELIMNGS